MDKKGKFWILFLVLAGTAVPGLCQPEKRIAVSIEGGLLWQSRNEIRVPNSTGTEFSLVEVIGSGPNGFFRAEADFNINERHGFRFVFAPLEISDSGILPGETLFAGELFEPDLRTQATYKFSSYRITYRYRFYAGPTWHWRIGATGFIRDARIALRQEGRFAEDTDVGFVPLIHLQGHARLSEDWRFVLDFDGLAASQGRAFDIAAKLGYSISENVEVGFGYRVIEGGADVEQVYNFAWFNSLVGSVRFRF